MNLRFHLAAPLFCERALKLNSNVPGHLIFSHDFLTTIKSWHYPSILCGYQIVGTFNILSCIFFQ